MEKKNIIIKNPSLEQNETSTNNCKIFIVTPEQIAKMGLAEQLKKAASDHSLTNKMLAPKNNQEPKAECSNNLKQSNNENAVKDENNAELEIESTENPIEIQKETLDMMIKQETKIPNAVLTKEVVTSMKNKLQNILEAKNDCTSSNSRQLSTLNLISKEKLKCRIKKVVLPKSSNLISNDKHKLDVITQQKVNILNNEQIHLPQNYIDELFKQECVSNADVNNIYEETNFKSRILDPQEVNDQMPGIPNLIVKPEVMLEIPQSIDSEGNTTKINQVNLKQASEIILEQNFDTDLIKSELDLNESKATNNRDLVGDVVNDVFIVQNSSQNSNLNKVQLQSKDINEKPTNQDTLTTDETNLIDEESLKNEIRVPKKRGRKKKIITDIKEIEETTPETNLIDEESLKNEIRVPKKRGRKKKIITEIKQIEETTPETNLIEEEPLKNEIRVPKKRGRKKKITTDIKQIEETTPETNLIDVEPLKNEIQVPKKRGQKKKITTDIEQIEETAPKYLKRSNRKKKIINYAALSEGTDVEEETDYKQVKTSNDTFIEIDATIYHDSSKNSTKCTYAVQKFVKSKNLSVKKTNNENEIENMSSLVKRRRGRPYVKNTVTKVVFDSLFNCFNNSNTSEAREANEVTSDPEIQLSKLDSSVTETKNCKPVKTRYVTCDVCKQQLEKSSWTFHNMRHHNNLAWKIGDTPLDLNDKALVINILNNLYKRKKPLYCEICGEPKKSVMGYLSHKSMCKRSPEEMFNAKIQCKHCGKSILPVSLSAHLKTCKILHTRDIVDANQYEDEEPKSKKRKAAKKAENLIKEFKDAENSDIKVCRAKFSKMWHTNFDFHPTVFGRRRMQKELNQHGIIKCYFNKCNFKITDVEEMLNHVWKCDKKPKEGYTCRFCIITFETEDDTFKHMKMTHSKFIDVYSCDNFVSSENDDEDEKEGVGIENRQSKSNNWLHGIKFLVQYRYCAPTLCTTFPPAWDWTLNFCQKHYSNTNLFSQWRMLLTDYPKLNPDMLVTYLPTLKYSADTARIVCKSYRNPLEIDYNWKRFKLFETETMNDGSSTIFCGGSIFAIAWAPTPYEQSNCEQILVVSINTDTNKEYTLDELYQESGLLQFWNCGSLKNNCINMQSPKLEFCIAHNYNPIWCLEWCPSGCYDLDTIDKFQTLLRLGLLAVGCANSHVYVYCICQPGQLSGKIFKPAPILKLILDTEFNETGEGIQPHVTRISWSKASGHQNMAVGYANGMVAIFNINTTSALLRIEANENEVQVIRPYRVFNAHHHAITALSLYHLNNGNRWLMTGSIDRTVKYWDMENPIVPLTNITKFIVTDGVWLNHWLSSAYTFDDSCGGGMTTTTMYQLRNFESESATIMHSNSRVTSITGSEWTNGFIQGNIVGEVKGFFPHQLFFCMDGNKSYRMKKVMLSYARLVEKNVSKEERVKQEQKRIKKMPNHEPSTYNEAVEKYGLVFCDMQVNSITDFTANMESYTKSNNIEKLYPTFPNIYPLQSIEKIAFNPNRNSYCYLATGYRAGFIRITYLKFLSNTRTKF